MITQIEGNSVSLRRVQKSDAQAIYANIRNPQIARNTLIPFPYTLDSAEQFLTAATRNWRIGTGYHFAILSNDTGKLTGVLGYQNIHDPHKRAEIGYWLGKRFWGRGYMTEAVELGVKFGFEQLKLNRIEAKVFTHNIGSCRVLEKCGFSLDGQLRQSIKRGTRYYDELVYSLLKKDRW